MQPLTRRPCPTAVQTDLVVEVVVRIGNELHDVAYLRDGTYRAGICDIAIDEVRDELARGEPLRIIERGLATITLRLAEAPRSEVPHKRLERRPLAYGVSSLALHLGLWLVAILYGATELLPSTADDVNGRRARRARISASFTADAQTVQRAAPPEPTETPVTTDTTPSEQPSPERDDAGGSERRAGVAREAARGRQPIAAPPGSEAGRDRRFDPDANPDFDTIKVGAFSTVSRGRLAGDDYGARQKRNGLIVVTCDASSCLVLGGENAAPVRRAVEANLAEITACYAHATNAAGRKIEIDVGVDAAGKVDNVQVGGVGDVGNCVAEIIKRTTFREDSSFGEPAVRSELAMNVVTHDE